jgi:hypothetical protein
MKDTIELAREAGLLPILNEDAFQKWEWEKTKKVIKRFAALVRADEREQSLQREKLIAERWAIECASQVEIEREACAQLCEDQWQTAHDIQDAIRNRGNT